MFFFSVKYVFISEVKGRNQNPFKLPFEALNYYTGLRASRANKNKSFYRI